jgi:hypothetical protein
MSSPGPPVTHLTYHLIVTNTFLQHTGICLPYYSSKPSPSCVAPLPVAITLRLHLHLYYLIIFLLQLFIWHNVFYSCSTRLTAAVAKLLCKQSLPKAVIHPLEDWDRIETVSIRRNNILR